MLVLRCLLLTAVMSCVGTSPSNAASWTAAKQSQVELLADMLVNGQNPPSAVIGISIDGTIVWQKGYGQIAPGKAPDINTMYLIGSVSKQFTALGILKLVEDAVVVPYSKQPLAVSTPVSDFFTNVEKWGPVTLSNLLTMTSGIPNHTSDPLAAAVAAGPRSAEEILARIKTFNNAGVGAFNYSNSNYFLLAQVIEIIRGAGKTSPPPRYSSYLQEKIFKPAKMSSTFVLGDEAPPSSSQAQPVYKMPAMFFAPEWPKGAGQIVSTAADLLRWDYALINGELCTSTSLQSMLAPVSSVPPAAGGGAYAMGWFVRSFPGGKVYQHAGAISGFTASNTVATLSDGSKVAVVVLTNTDGVQQLEKFAQDVVATVAN